MSSIGFDLLDRHVVDGRSDHVACSDATGILTFARLLERSASLAGGLQALGVRDGDEVGLDLEPGNHHVILVCACARLGAVPGTSGSVHVVAQDDGPVVRAGDDSIDVALLTKAGATEPAPSLPADAPGYRDRLRASAPDVIDALLAGSPVRAP